MGWRQGWVRQEMVLSSSSARPDAVSNKLQGSNIFTIAKRNVEGQDMLYQSLKLTNGIWVLAELRIQPSNPSFTVRPGPCCPLLSVTLCPSVCPPWGCSSREAATLAVLQKEATSSWLPSLPPNGSLCWGFVPFPPPHSLSLWDGWDEFWC